MRVQDLVAIEKFGTGTAASQAFGAGNQCSKSSEFASAGKMDGCESGPARQNQSKSVKLYSRRTAGEKGIGRFATQFYAVNYI